MGRKPMGGAMAPAARQAKHRARVKLKRELGEDAIAFVRDQPLPAGGPWAEPLLALKERIRASGFGDGPSAAGSPAGRGGDVDP